MRRSVHCSTYSCPVRQSEDSETDSGRCTRHGQRPSWWSSSAISPRLSCTASLYCLGCPQFSTKQTYSTESSRKCNPNKEFSFNYWFTVYNTALAPVQKFKLFQNTNCFTTLLWDSASSSSFLLSTSDSMHVHWLLHVQSSVTKLHAVKFSNISLTLCGTFPHVVVTDIMHTNKQYNNKT